MTKPPASGCLVDSSSAATRAPVRALPAHTDRPTSAVTPDGRELYAQPVVRRAAATVAVALVVLAAGVRGWALGADPLWMDEAATVRLLHGDLWDLLDPARHFENTPPLYYLLMHGWLATVGSIDSDTSLRTPSAIIGVATVLIGGWVARQIAGRFILFPAMTMGLLAVDWAAVYFSREARAYALFLALATASLGLAVALVRRPTGFRAILLAVALAATWWTHYSTVAVVLALNVGTMVALLPAHAGTRRRALLGWWAAAQALLLVLIAPTLPWLFGAADGLRGDLDRSLGASIGHLGTYAWLFGTSWALAGLALAALLGLIRGRCEPWIRAMLLALAVLPVGVPLVAWLAGGPAFFPRHAVASVAAISLLAALGVTTVANPTWRRTAAVGLLAWIAGGTFAARDRLAKPPMRDAARYVAQSAESGDTVVVSLMMAGWSFDRYFPRLDTRRRNYDDFTVRAVARGGPDIRTIWLVLCQNPHTDAHLFAGSPMRVTAERRFGSIRVLRTQRITAPVGQSVQ